MNKIKYAFQNIVIGCLILASTALSATAAPRAFVSTGGDDANSCGRNQPCRNFAAAVAAVDAGGEVVVLDSGGFGAVTITKSVRIIAPEGVHAAINATSGNAVTIAAGANDAVILSGLTLNGSNNFGINFDSGAALHVENCVINNFFRGILFDAAGKLFVKDTIVRNGFVGIYLEAISGAIQASIDRTLVENNRSGGVIISENTRAFVSNSSSSGNTFNGFTVIRNGKLTISQSTASNNGQDGFSASGGAFAVLTVDDCTATGNGNAGVIAGGGSGIVVRVSNSTATDNAVGFSQANLSTFESYGNNRVRGNTNNTVGVITTVGEI